MRAVVAGLLLATGWLAEPRAAVGLSVQEAILRAKPAVALVTAEIRADVTMNCGQGPVEVSPAPFIETGTGWFVDGRGFLITNAHVVDPAHRLPPWVTHELKKKAIEQACVEPALRARGLIRGQRPEVEEQIRLEASVTNGAVSGFKQDQIGQGVIQSDAPAAHGNSGGPAVTDDATVVGVMTFISLSSSGSEVQGFNFLIPAKDVAKFLEGTEVT